MSVGNAQVSTVFFEQKKKGFEFFSGMKVVQESWNMKKSLKKGLK